MKRRLATAYAGTSFMDPRIACFNVFKLIGRYVGILHKHTGASNGSLNKLGLSGTLRAIKGGMSSSLKQTYGALHNASSGTVHVLRGDPKSIITGMIQGGIGSTELLAKFFTFTGVSLQLSLLYETMAQRSKNSLNVSKPAVQRLMSSMSFVQSLALFILLFVSYVSNIDSVSTKSELQGLYIIGTTCHTCLEVLISKVYSPTMRNMNAQQRSNLNSGQICPKHVEDAFAKHRIRTSLKE